MIVVARPLVQINGLSSEVASKLRFLVRHTAWMLAQVSFPPTHSTSLPDGNSIHPLAPASGTGAKIWTCFDNLPAQQWTYTPDNYIRLTNTGA